MKYDNEDIKYIIGESENDLKLKKFIDRTKEVFGDDYATLVLSCDYDLKKSLDKFSSKLGGLDSIHIQFLLLQSAVLSSNNPYKDLIDRKMLEDDFQSLFPFIASNICFRKGLIRLFINQSSKTNLEILNGIENEEEKEKILNSITELKRYERFLKVQEEVKNSYTPRKTKKRGNRYY